MDTDVNYQLDDHSTAWITLNGPTTRNALALSTLEKLQTALRRADREARVIVLRGAPGAFSSGADLSAASHAAEAPPPAAEPEPAAPLSSSESDAAPASTPVAASLAAPNASAGHDYMDTHYNGTVRLIRELLTPVVVSLNAVAAGAGLSLALAGDLIIAADSAYLLSPFQRLGIGPDTGASYQLVRTVGRVRAAEIAMLSERITATQAQALGLINYVVPDAELDEATRALAHRLADGPARTLGFTHRLLWQALDGTFEEALEHEVETLKLLRGKPESREGQAAFAQKRQPNFRDISE